MIESRTSASPTGASLRAGASTRCATNRSIKRDLEVEWEREARHPRRDRARGDPQAGSPRRRELPTTDGARQSRTSDLHYTDPTGETFEWARASRRAARRSGRDPASPVRRRGRTFSIECSRRLQGAAPEGFFPERVQPRRAESRERRSSTAPSSRPTTSTGAGQRRGLQPTDRVDPSDQESRRRPRNCLSPIGEERIVSEPPRAVRRRLTTMQSHGALRSTAATRSRSRSASPTAATFRSTPSPASTATPTVSRSSTSRAPARCTRACPVDLVEELRPASRAAAHCQPVRSC